jgi:DNA polymerase-3 subunit delta
MTGLLDADPAKANPADVLDELRTPSFFASKRIVLIKNADDFISENRPLLEKYFDNPSSCGILVLMVKSWRANTKLAGKLSKVGELVSVQNISARQLPRYLVGYAHRKHEKALSRSAAELLVELAGDELGRLCSEVDKLVLFAESEKEITAEHVEALIGHNRLFGAFQVIAAMTNGDTAGASQRLRRMFAADKKAPYTTVGAFAYHFRRMFNAAAMLQKGHSAGRIASQLRLWGDTDTFIKQVRRLGLEKIGSILAELARIDYETKTGQATTEVAIEQLIFKLT